MGSADRHSRPPARLFWLILAAALAACGVKANPYPAAATLPGQVRNLTQTVTEEGELILRWLPPETNMVGRPLKALGGFQVEMADSLADDRYCLACPPRYRPDPVDRLSAVTPPPDRDLAPGPYEWRRQLAEGHVYHFRVAAMAPNGGVHPEAKVETVVWALAAPGALRFSAALGEKAVALSWTRPGPGYRVEVEKRTAEDASWLPLSGLDPASGRFTDLGVAYENTYGYRARLIKVKDETGIQGPWSKEFKIRVIDLTPPPPPGHLDAVLTTGGVRLAWESLALDPDVAGYRVYRQLTGEDKPVLLTPTLLKENIFFDPAPETGTESLRYQVTAVDGSPQANESRPSPVAEVFLEPRAD